MTLKLGPVFNIYTSIFIIFFKYARYQYCSYYICKNWIRIFRVSSNGGNFLSPLLHYFDQKPLILPFLWSFWPFCPNCPPLADSNWKTLIFFNKQILCRWYMAFESPVDLISPKIKTIPKIVYVRPSRHGCISDTSQRRLIHRLRDMSKRSDLQISETSPERLIRDVSLETSLRSLRFSQRRLWVASETVIFGLKTKESSGYLLINLWVFKYFDQLI